MEIINLIKAAMAYRGMTQEETGKLLSMHKSNFNRFIMKNNNLRISELQAIADALGYDLSISLIDRQTGKRIDA